MKQHDIAVSSVTGSDMTYGDTSTWNSSVGMHITVTVYIMVTYPCVSVHVTIFGNCDRCT